MRAGLTPAEALRAATFNPALFLNMSDRLGSIAEGKIADLVLLDADPLRDIRNTARIRAIIADGRRGFVLMCPLSNCTCRFCPSGAEQAEQRQTIRYSKDGASGY